MRVLGMDKQMLLERDFKDGGVKSTFNKLREVLTEYIEGVKKADEERAAGSDDPIKQEKTVILLSIDRTDGGILTGDYESIMAIIEEVENAYDDGY